MNWKKTMSVFILSASLLIPSSNFHVIAEEASQASSKTDDYYLTGLIKASVKSVLNEQIAAGTRIGAVVRLTNEGVRVTGVPEYEVRVRTKEGVEYTLRPSSGNAKSIQPKETVELSYLITVDRYEAFSLQELSWVDVDEYVYPKLEKKVKSIPITSIEWKGENAVLSDSAAIKQWGEAFTIPVLSNSIEFKPVSLIEQNTPQGPVTIVGLLAKNNGELKKAIPDFRIDGKTDKKVYSGKRLEQGTLSLEAGEQRSVHYAIPAGNRTDLKSLNILTGEEFAVDAQTKVNYSVGRLNVTVPDKSTVLRTVNQLQPYEFNNPIRFDPLSGLVQPEVDVAMVDLQLHNSSGGAYKAAVAKFKLHNRSDRPIAIPRFQADLTSSGGHKYTGTRQATEVETLIPNISYVIYYSFILPSSETGEQLAMEILDGETVAPFKIPIAAFKTYVKEESGEGSLAFYPFKVDLIDWTVSRSYNAASSVPYSNKLNLDWSVHLQDEVVVDQSFAKLKVEVADEKGKIFVAKAFSLTGENRLTNGTQTISFDTDRLETTFILHLYETVDTPFGEVKRLIRTER